MFEGCSGEFFEEWLWDGDLEYRLCSIKYVLVFLKVMVDDVENYFFVR